MDYKILIKEQDLINERDTWNRICELMPYSTPFQTWEWNYIWWKNNEPVDSLFVIKAFVGNTVYGYAPLVVKNNTAEFIGGRDMDYGQFVVRDKAMTVIEGILNLILDKKIALALQEMPSRTPQIHIIQKLLERKKRFLLHKTTRTAYVDLKQYPSVEAYYKLLSQSMRNKTLKVGLKNNLSIRKEEVSDKLFAEIEDIYSNRQEIRGGASDITWAFPVIEQMNRENLLNVYVARKEDEAVGFLVSMIYKNAQYIWLVAFKMEYRNCFPGQILFYQSIKDGFEDKNNRVDFMRGDYDFKMRWECSIDTNYTLYLYNSTVSYLKNKVWFAVRPHLKNIVYGNKTLKRMYKKHAK